MSAKRRAGLEHYRYAVAWGDRVYVYSTRTKALKLNPGNAAVVLTIPQCARSFGCVPHPDEVLKLRITVGEPQTITPIPAPYGEEGSAGEQRQAAGRPVLEAPAAVLQAQNQQAPPRGSPCYS